MKKLWHFLSRPQNLAVLAAIGAVIAFFWKDVISPAMTEKNAHATDASQQTAVGDQTSAATPPVVNQTAHTGSGGIAINATGAARVSVTPSADSANDADAETISSVDTGAGADDSSSPDASAGTHP